MFGTRHLKLHLYTLKTTRFISILTNNKDWLQNVKNLTLNKINNNNNNIIITLFQEYNVFGTDASLTYGPELTNVDMLLKK